MLKTKLLTLAVANALITTFGTAKAATINVTTTTTAKDAADGECGVIEAVENANTNSQLNLDCDAGDGVDTISLPSNSVLDFATAAPGFNYGYNALPTLTGELTIDGNNSTWQRTGGCNLSTPADGSKFRFLSIGGTVSISDLTMQGGCIDNGGYAWGGAVFVRNNQSLTLNNVTLRDNTAQLDGGALATRGTLEVNSSTLSNNSSSGDGGAVYVGTGSETTIYQSVVDGNVAASGGGVAADSHMDLEIFRSTVSNNTAAGTGGGGGISNQGGNLLVYASTLSGNRTTDSTPGGGILARSGDVYVVRSTLSGNLTNDYGGGIYTQTALTLVDSTLVDNRTDAGGLPLPGSQLAVEGFPSPSVTVLRSLLSGDPASSDICSLTGPDGGSDNQSTDGSCGNISAVTVTRADLNLGALANNGGPTATHALGPGSVAIDAAGTGCSPTDQRGETAPFDGDLSGTAECDAGAFEVIEVQQTGPDFVVNALGDAGDGDCLATSGDCTLRDAVLAANSDPNLSEITFDAGVFAGSHTITLTQGELVADQSIIVTGPGADRLTLDADGQTRVFHFADLTASTNDALVTTNRLSGMTFTGGDANAMGSTDPARRGGAIRTVADLTLEGMALRDNISADGGAIWSRFGDLTVEASTLSGNSGNKGGAIYHRDGASTLTLDRTTISGNSASGNGGAMLVDSGLLSVQRSTIANNTSGTNAAAVFHGGGASATLTGSIIAGSNGADLAGSFEANYSLIQNANGTITSGGNNLLGVDPLLSPLGGNGGDSQTHRPLLDSPVIDAGGSACGGMTDQRGEPRPVDGDGLNGAECDIGAIELQSVPTEVTQTGPNFSVNALDDAGDGSCGVELGECTLRDALNAANQFDDASMITFDGSVAGGIVSIATTLPSPIFDTNIAGSDETLQPAAGMSGSLMVGGSESLQISDMTWQNAIGASNGGALHLNSGTTTLTRMAFLNNEASGAGGALYIGEGSAATVIESTFDGNRAVRGGAVAAVNHQGARIERSTLSNNTATDRGGAAFHENRFGTLYIANSTISANEASNLGGGVATPSSFNHAVQITDSTIVYNTAAGETQLFRGESTMTVTGTLVADTGADNCSPGSMTFVDSLSTDATCAGATAVTLAALELAPLADNGGATLTHALGAGSVAIEAGGTACTPTDQRREPLFDADDSGIAECDAGAYEFQEPAQPGPGFVVNANDDAGDGTCGIEVGECTLRDALIAANDQSDLSEVTFDPMVFATLETITLSGTPLEITESVNLSGSGETLLAISGNNTSAVLAVTDGDSSSNIDVSISDLTIRDGAGDGAGGGLLAEENLTLTRVTISNNTATNSAGGLSFTGRNNGELNLDDVELLNNQGVARAGGANISATGGSIAISDSNVSGNTVLGSRGGGIRLNATDGASVTIINSAFDDNQVDGTNVDRGGGLWLYLGDSSGSISQSTFTGNSAGSAGGGPSPNSRGKGGGLFAAVYYGSTLGIDQTTVSNNTAGGEGGGRDGGGMYIYTYSDSTARLSNSTVSGNNAFDEGGGLYLVDNDDNTLIELDGVVIENNQSRIGGGFDATANVRLLDSNVTNNQASDSGGGIEFAEQALTIDGGSLAFNTVTGGDGGAINSNLGSLTITDAYLNNNSASGNGGVLNVVETTATTITNATITSNTADDSGGIARLGSGADLTITDSRLLDSRAGGAGGAIQHFGGGTGTLTLRNSVVWRNQADRSGGIDLYGTPTVIENSTITSNTATVFNAGGISVGGNAGFAATDATIYNNVATTGGNQLALSEVTNAGVLTFDRSVIAGAGEVCGGVIYANVIASTQSFASDTTCTGVVDTTLAEINLGAVATNGGPSRNHLPLPGSILIDAAMGCSGTDQRGQPRNSDADGVAGDDCDIGAVEVQNTPVVATDDPIATDQDTATAANVLGNDNDASDEDSGVLSVVAVNGEPANVGTTLSSDGGEVTINADGTASFAPQNDFDALGAGDSAQVVVDYTVSDGLAESDAQLLIIVNGLNDAPIAEDSNANTVQGTSVTAAFGSSDIDVGELLTHEVVTAPSEGSVAIDQDEFTFDPGNDFDDLDDGETRDVSFTFQARDEALTSNPATVQITVSGQNDAPVAGDDSYNTTGGTVLNVDAAGGLLSNDSDVDDEPLSVSAGVFSAGGIGGTFTLNADGSFSFAAPDTSGIATLDYTVTDGDESSTATITINVDLPEADLQIDKTDNVDVVEADDVLTYTITVLNDGPADVTGAQVQDTLPTELNNASWTCELITSGGTAPCTTAIGSGNIDEAVDLAAGDAAEFVLMATVIDASGSIENTATVTAPMDVVDPDLSNNSATDVNVSDGLFSDGFESTVVLASFAARSAIVSQAQIEANLAEAVGYQPVLVVHAQDRAQSDLNMALVHARRFDGETQVRISRFEDGLWVVGDWEATAAPNVRLNW